MNFNIFGRFIINLLAWLWTPFRWIQTLISVDRRHLPTQLVILANYGRVVIAQLRQMFTANLERCATAYAVCIAITMVMAHQAHAQPYFTNTASGTFFGAQQYNQSLALPYNPSYTINRQLIDGIMAGSFNSGTNGGSTCITNTYLGQFGTYTNYSATPAIYLQQQNATPTAGTVYTNQVLFATTTNFAIWFGGASNVTYSLLVVGH